MATQVLMPQLSDTMHEGKILHWRKKEGESVSRGDVLAEVETDKATLEIEAFQNGYLLKITTPEGVLAKVGEQIAIIGAIGEEAKTTPPEINLKSQLKQVTPEPLPTSTLLAPSSHIIQSESSSRIKASPLARKIASQENLDLTLIHGSGPEGRIIKKDIDRALTTPSSRTLPTATPPSSTPTTSSTTLSQSTTQLQGTLPGQLKPLSKMRQTIARRMQESIAETPHFYITTIIDMRQTLRMREVLKSKLEFKDISLNHMIIKACGYALNLEPGVNCSLRNGQLFIPAHINLGIITVVDDGLLIPVIREANQLPLRDIVFEAKAAVERARAGRPNATDLSGGTFSISNMGMFDVDNFTAIINPGQGAVLAVSSLREEPIVENGSIVIGKRMKVTLSVDHRIIDGVMGAKFLKHLKDALEIPGLLMI